jgi:hypothetical protein
MFYFTSGRRILLSLQVGVKVECHQKNIAGLDLNTEHYSYSNPEVPEGISAVSLFVKSKFFKIRGIQSNVFAGRLRIIRSNFTLLREI